jgi:hypothetical protein
MYVMKSAILLTTAIFLLSAPAPDSKTMSEASAGLLAPKHESGLMASEEQQPKTTKIVKAQEPEREKIRAIPD